MQIDISSEAEVQSMVARACAEFGTVHILINNAARFVFNFVTDITEEGTLLPFERHNFLEVHQVMRHIFSVVNLAHIPS